MRAGQGTKKFACKGRGEDRGIKDAVGESVLVNIAVTMEFRGKVR